MTAPQYTPQSPDDVNTLADVKRIVEAILRNNPLQGAVTTKGLMKWLGNYNTTGSSERINFLWIGEFLPADPNLGNIPQRGFSLVRDDSRGGVSAIAMYDAYPTGPGGLRQTLFITSGDGKRMLEEAREGGQKWPQTNVWMGALGSDFTQWPYTTSATYDTIYEGRVDVVGNQLAYRVLAVATGSGVGSMRLRVEGVGGDVIGTVHAVTTGSLVVFDSTVDVSASRGSTCTVRWEALRSSGVGDVRARIVTVRCYTQ